MRDKSQILTDHFEADDGVDGSCLLEIDSASVVSGVGQTDRVDVQEGWPVVDIEICSTCQGEEVVVKKFVC